MTSRKIRVILFIIVIVTANWMVSFADINSSYVREKSIPVISPRVYNIDKNAVNVWIAFTDKKVFSGDDHSRIIEQSQITQKALERRAKVGIDYTFRDIPVPEDYVSTLETEFGVTRGVVSRWLNAVSVEIPKEILLDIAEKKFVADIRPVAGGVRDGLLDWDTGISWKGLDGINADASEDIHEGAFYGNSYDQLEQIDAIEAHRRGYYGDGVIIGVLDGGFQMDHSALLHVDLIDEWDFINNDGYTGYDPEQDVKGQPNHGTACLSNIGAYSPGNLIGAAPYASFLLGKSEDITQEEPIEEDNMVAAFEWFERMGADIVSTSLSYSDWYVKADYDGKTCYASIAADIAVQFGMVIVTSQGNSGPYPITIGTPGDAESVIAVGAVDSLDRLTRFSSRGPTADGRIKPNLLALGRHATIARPHTWNRYGLANGTSFSCPIAAGGLALVLQAHPDWTPWQLMEAAENTATRSNRPDNDFGYGILQVAKAIDYPSVSGYVRTEDGNAVESAKVTLRLSSSEDSFETETDASGFYLIPNLPKGEYEVRVMSEGGEMSEPRTVQVPPDDRYDFSLKKKRIH